MKTGSLLAGSSSSVTASSEEVSEDQHPVLGHTQEHNIVARVLGPDKYVFEVIFTDPEHKEGAKEFMAVEITQNRASC